MSSPIRVSPSQIATWIDCPRKWAYDRCRTRVQNKYAAFGTAVHSYIARWLTYRVPPDRNDEGECALAGLGLLPLPPQSWVESPFEFLYDGVLYNGIRDLVSGFVYGSSVAVTDHKSTGNLAWAKTPDDLLWDPQWLTYGVSVMLQLPVRHVAGQWVYYQRKPPRARDVWVLDSVESLWTKFEWQHRTFVLPLAQSRRMMPPEPWRNAWIEAHPRCSNAGARDSTCNKYGGCQHRGECLTKMNVQQRIGNYR